MMKRVITFFIGVLAVGMAGLMLTACQGKQETQKIYTIDEVYAAADSLVGDTIVFEGTCMHLCKYAGRKAFLQDAEETNVLRVNAGQAERFVPECLHNTVRVTGVLKAIDVQPEEQQAGCESEEKASRKYFAEAVSYVIL